jgi:DNA-binding transcriptional regulator GbsR (MarR family)
MENAVERRSMSRQPTGDPTAKRRTGPPALSEEELQFADELGFFWEDAGGTRMAGRVLGALLLADPPGLSSSELANSLDASSGSISTATRELIRPGIAERVRVTGTRQNYFRATLGTNLTGFLRTRLEITRRSSQIMRRGEALAAAKDTTVQRQLEEIREFFEFVAEEQLAILERWEQKQQTRRTKKTRGTNATRR